MMRDSFATFMEYTAFEDFLAISWSVFAFISFVILAVVLRKRIKLSIFIFMLAFVVLFGGVTFIRDFIHSKYYGIKFSDVEFKKLIYSKTLVIKGKVTNIGKKDIQKCLLTSDILSLSNNYFKSILNSIKPIKRYNINILDIKKGFDEEFKIVAEPFEYNKEFNITMRGKCI